MSRLNSNNPSNQEFANKILKQGVLEFNLPPEFQNLIWETAKSVIQGKDVEIKEIKQDLTTQEAADILNVSRPFLVQLLEDRKISHHKVGTHRRVQRSDLIAFKEKQEIKAEKALEKLLQESEELGLY